MLILTMVLEHVLEGHEGARLCRVIESWSTMAAIYVSRAYSLCTLRHRPVVARKCVVSGLLWTCCCGHDLDAGKVTTRHTKTRESGILAEEICYLLSVLAK